MEGPNNEYAEIEIRTLRREDPTGMVGVLIGIYQRPDVIPNHIGQSTYIMNFSAN
jgi:hypothetical protein